MREPGGFACPPGNLEGQMAYKETFWMACDSTEQLRAEYGPFIPRRGGGEGGGSWGFGYWFVTENLLGRTGGLGKSGAFFWGCRGGPRAVATVRPKLTTGCAT